MGSLLTFPAPALPLGCRAKELAALVLLLVSACRVVLAEGMGPDGDGVCELPQAASKAKRHTAATVITERKRMLVFTTTPGN